MAPPTQPPAGGDAEPHVVIEMGGENIVVRATSHVDHAYTESLADVLNAASETQTSVVIDPQPIRCDDVFAAFASGDVARRHASPAGRPVDVEVAATGVLRIRARRDTWFVDVRRGRLCRCDGTTGASIRFLGSEVWGPIVAVCVTPTRVVAQRLDGVLLSAERLCTAA